ncbi:hypothetical protein CAEBREN_03996 [Caenorhabditis brenneri]|uniref:Uncharacterized protein n=1 Tax=Caenorhabditis brenneri TaxID=135651 RepID=G0NKK3_CAEBE|nr:hypothetical protein CAEBREN_03996 [Caenorhabditis brenneri]
MSNFIKVVRKGRAPNEEQKGSYTWRDKLVAFEKGKGKFVSVDAFCQNLLVDCNDLARDDICFEMVVHDYDEQCEGVEARWFVRVDKLCGYRALAHFVGCTDKKSKFWVNVLSDEVFHIANANMIDENMERLAYAPPTTAIPDYTENVKQYIDKCIENEIVGTQSISRDYQNSRENLHKPRFRIGQRLELLHYTNSTLIRVARVVETCGRRLMVRVMQADYPGDIDDEALEEDRQFENSKPAPYWIDEGSFLIFPVGFAAVNEYELQAKRDYKEHSRRVAEAILKGEEPDYHPDDIKFSDLKKDPVNMEHWDKLKKGQKLEVIDPLAQEFKLLKVATILKFLPTPGYIVVGIDGENMIEESVPLHISAPFMYPVGYAKEYNMQLEMPDNYKKKKFNWDTYLEEEKAEKMPIELFRPFPSEERLAKFKVGMHLEAADMCENHYICPATITSIHGRIINVNFDGWESDFDEVYDVDSHDIFPIGWCELHNYFLQTPKRDNY